MTPTKNPPVGVPPHATGSIDYKSSSSGNVVALRSNFNPASPFQRLTAQMILAQHRAGTLPEGILVALLAGVGLHP
jgi:hypothetical protein